MSNRNALDHGPRFVPGTTRTIVARHLRARVLIGAALLVGLGPARSPAQGPLPTAPAVESPARSGRLPVPPPEPRPTPPAAAEDLGMRLSPAPLDAADLPLPINLATALKLSDARPLIVAAAQASVWVAEAQLKRAQVLWVPTLLFGPDYIRHDGGGPDFNKGILTAPSVNFFYAGGGLYQYVNVADAYFEPLAARQVLASRRWEIQAARNDALMQTADAYFRVHEARGMYAGAIYAVERGRDLVRRIDQLSGDLVPRDEVDRARNVLADLEQQATSARANWRVASADLTQVLRLDPRAVVVPQEHDHLQVTLIDPSRSLDDLMAVGLTTRPELAANQALVEAATTRIRREKMRPVLPNVLLNGFQTPGGMLQQAGIFGFGPNSSLNQFTGRADVSIQLVWQLEGVGIGNLARIKQQRGEQSQAVVELFRMQDRVAAEINASHARLQSASARVGQATVGLRAAILTFNGNFEGLQQTRRFGDVLVLVNRPEEVTYALVLFKLAVDEYFRTVAESNRAQFGLFHALGYPAAEVSNLRTPGEVAPVETARPAYLPPVGNGPPPASR